MHLQAEVLRYLYRPRHSNPHVCKTSPKTPLDRSGRNLTLNTLNHVSENVRTVSVMTSDPTLNKRGSKRCPSRTGKAAKKRRVPTGTRLTT